jgi:hypothetical protein
MAIAAAEKSQLLGRRLLIAQAKESEGWSWDRLDDPDKATAAFAVSRDLAQAGGNLRAAAAAQNGMANALYDKGDLEGARKSHEDSLKLARQVGAQGALRLLPATLATSSTIKGNWRRPGNTTSRAWKLTVRLTTVVPSPAT